MSGSISDSLENNDLSSLTDHLGKKGSQMVDQEYRDILENLFQKSKSVPAGTYTLHGLTIAGGEYSDEARIVFKYPNNNRKGVYHDHLLSKRGTDFVFLNDDNEVVNPGSEINESTGSTYGAGEFAQVYFNGPQYNPTSNVKKIRFFKKTEVSTWMSTSEIESSFDDPSDSIPVTQSATTKTSDNVYSGSDTRYWYDLDLTQGNVFTINYNPSSSDCLLNLSLKNANTFYEFVEPNVTGDGNMSWGFLDATSGNRSLSSGPYFSHNIKLFIKKTGSTTCSSSATISRLNLDFGSSVVEIKLERPLLLKFDSSSSLSDIYPVNIKLVRSPVGWFCSLLHDFNGSVSPVKDEMVIKTKNGNKMSFQLSFKSEVKIDWGDGTSSTFTNDTENNQKTEVVTKTYASSAVRTITIAGDVKTLFFYLLPNGSYLSDNSGSLFLDELKISGLPELSLSYIVAATSISKLDLSEFTGRPNTLSNMCKECASLTEVTGLERLNVSKVSDIDFIFRGCYKLANLSGIENWNLMNLAFADYAFYYFGTQLSSSDPAYSLDLSNWSVPNVTSAPNGFATNGILEGETSRLPSWGS
jgi:hypothetical protein